MLVVDPVLYLNIHPSIEQYNHHLAIYFLEFQIVIYNYHHIQPSQLFDVVYIHRKESYSKVTTKEVLQSYKHQKKSPFIIFSSPTEPSIDKFLFSHDFSF